MSESKNIHMDGIEIESFLESQTTGVLALADEDDAYAIPISFAYDDEVEKLYFRLGYAPGSRKQQFVESSELVTFVVSDETPDGWKSVVVEGRLSEMGADSLDAAIVEATNKLDIPYFKVHDRPASDLQFTIVEMDPTGMSGITEEDSGGSGPREQ